MSDGIVKLSIDFDDLLAKGGLLQVGFKLLGVILVVVFRKMVNTRRIRNCFALRLIAGTPMSSSLARGFGLYGPGPDRAVPVEASGSFL